MNDRLNRTVDRLVHGELLDAGVVTPAIDLDASGDTMTPVGRIT